MGNYTIIADTGMRLVTMLQDALVPELISSDSEIGLRSPEDRGDVALGLFLYDVRQSEEVFQPMRVVHNERISRPPLYLSLYYMITAYARGDAAYRLTQDALILGRVIQFFHDNPVIPVEKVDAQAADGIELHVQMLDLDMDEKSKIWSFPNVGNRLSLFYRISSVAVDSAVSRAFARVAEVDVHVSPREVQRD